MKRRCCDVRFKDFANYGGRGIRVCERWENYFAAFLEDMGPRPSREHQIDRINPEAGYDAGNCRWVTAMQNLTENKRDMCPVSIAGIYYPNRSAACAAFGISPTTVSERLKAGYSVEEAITAPKRGLSRKRPRESYLPKSMR